MFRVDGTTIELSRGDTGAVRIIAETDYEFQDEYYGDPTHGDRAVFTVKDAAGSVVREKYFPIDENNGFNVIFLNSDTDTLQVGGYTWDVRYVLHPYYDAQGRIVDGDQVITPNAPMQITLLTVVGEV